MFPKGVLKIVKESALCKESRERPRTLQNADRQLPPQKRADQLKSSGADPSRRLPASTLHSFHREESGKHDDDDPNFLIPSILGAESEDRSQQVAKVSNAVTGSCPALKGAEHIDERSFLSIQNVIAELKEGQEQALSKQEQMLKRHEESLRNLIQTATDSLASDVRSSKDECLAKTNAGIQGIHGMQQMVGRLEMRIEDVYHSRAGTSQHDQGIDIPEQQSDGSSPLHRQTSPAFRDALGKSKDEHYVQVQNEDAQMWSDFQDAVDNAVFSKNMYRTAFAKSQEVSVWHTMSVKLGIDHCLWQTMPPDCFAKITENPVFMCLQTLLILGNVAIMGYETNSSIEVALQEPPGEIPKWIDEVNKIFNYVFLVELLFRMAVLRSWFFVSPGEWGWNLFDFLVVTLSLLIELFSGFNFSFLRAFRILRAVRAVRIVRVLRFFRELRKILFAILGSLVSLSWCFVFLAMVMFMFSILFLQGLANALVDMEPGEHRRSVALVRQYYSSMGDSMFSLLLAVTGGVDWTEPAKPLELVGPHYTAAFVLYVVFITVGVMNVLTGVFLSNGDDCSDHSLVIQNEQVRVEKFVVQMMDLFAELDVNKQKALDWSTFKKAMSDDTVQAYLSSYDLDPTHAKLIFDLLDEDRTGRIDLTEFVMGMVRLKGSAKAIDARMIQRELGLMPKLIDHKLKLESSANLP